MQFAMDVSFSDFPRRFGKSEATWGESGVRNIIDSIQGAGVNRIHWRITCSGPFNYPTKVEGADTYHIEGPSGKRLDGIDFREFDSLAVAVDYAHSRGMEIHTWFDQTDSHGDPAVYPSARLSKWYADHPQFGCRGRGGLPYPKGGIQQLSLSYPEVREYKLAVIKELIDYGVDGVFLVFLEYVGYEEPIVESFRAKYGVDPNEIPENDERWVKHRGEVITAYLREARKILYKNGHSKSIELIVESQLGGPSNDLVRGIWRKVMESQIETLVGGGIIDGVSFFGALSHLKGKNRPSWYGEEWSTRKVREVKNLLEDCKLVHRYRVWARMSKMDFQQEMERMRSLGVDLFVVNEATPIEMYGQWGMLRDLTAKNY